MPEQSTKPAVIAAIATVLAAALTVAGGIYLHQKTSHNENTQPTPIPRSGDTSNPISLASPILNSTPTPDPVEIHKPRLMSAIRLADYAQIDAFRTLDPARLYKAFTGEALRSHLTEIENLKSEGLAVVLRLENQQFQSFKVSADGLRAEVKVIETWSSTVYWAATQQCFGHIPSHEAPQTIFLERKEDVWVVDTETHDRFTPPDMVPC